MTVKILKELLKKYPEDCDDMSIILCSAQGSQKGFDLLVGTGYIPFGDRTYVALVGIREIQRRVKAGEMEPPPDYVELPELDEDPPLPGDEWKNG